MTDFRDEDEVEAQQEKEKKARAAEFSKLLDASMKSTSRKLSVGDRIKSEILVIGQEEVFVSTGGRHDGSVPRRDFLDVDGNMTHKVGDKVELYVTLVKGNEVRLSPNKTSKNLAEDLEDAYDMMLPVEGRVAEVVKGGFRVSIHGVLTFCPLSQMDVVRIEVPEEYVGKKLEFRITKFGEGGKNVVVSRRMLLDEQKEESQGSFLAEHKAGELVPGKVRRLEAFGAFVELAPGVDGLVHISEIAWSRIGAPGEVLTVGQEVDVKILKIETQEDGRTRIALSIKQAGERPARSLNGDIPVSDAGGALDPWSQFAQKWAVGTVAKGKVERKEPYGLFVKLAEGVTGLLHKSRALDQPHFNYDKVKLGDEIDVQIAEVRAQERRVSLEIPSDPEAGEWKSYEAKATGSAGGSFGGLLGEQLKKALSKRK